MTSFLRLAAGLLERAANPAYGGLENESAALELGLALADLDDRLPEEVGLIRRVDDLTGYGWMWLLEWASARGAIINDDVLLDLAERSEDASLVSRIISYQVDVANSQDASRSEWFDQLIERVAPNPRLDDEVETNIGPARAVLMALLFVDAPLTQVYAANLVQYEWPGQDELRRHFDWWRDRQEPQLRREWDDRLDLGGPDLTIS